MKYMGSKNRIAKHILPIMLAERKEGQFWVEPFVGGANMIDKVDGNRIGGEYNKYIAHMWQRLEAGWVPKDDYTKQDYEEIKANKERLPFETGYVGIACSYSGKWFGGFAGKVNTKQGLRDYQKEAHKNVMAQVVNIKGVDFRHTSYDDLTIPSNSIIYCDPPYAGTTKYKDDFNHDKFWQWCRDMSDAGHTIFISEYNAPNDFECIWSMGVKSSLSANGKIGASKNSIEKLFRIAQKRIEDIVVEKG